MITARPAFFEAPGAPSRLRRISAFLSRNETASIAFAALASYFVSAVAADAIGWWLLFDERALAERMFDYTWELQLPWRAGRGEWAGRDFESPTGPLWQFLVWLPISLAGFSPELAVAGTHLVFPLASVAMAIGLARWIRTHEWGRAWVLLGLGLLALYDDFRSFRSLLSLSAAVVYTIPPRRVAHSHWAPVCAAGIATASMLLSFEGGALCLLSVAACSLSEIVVSWPDRKRLRSSLRRFGRFAGSCAALQCALGLFFLLWGGSYLRYIAGSVRISRFYMNMMTTELREIGMGSTLLLVGAAVAFAGVALWKRFRNPITVALLAGVAPLLLRALFRSDAEHLYAGFMPVAGALVIIASPGARSARKPLRMMAGALSVVFMATWFSAYWERPMSWKPSVFSRALDAMSGARNRETDFESHLGSAARWTREHLRAGGTDCIVLDETIGAIHAIANVGGPTQSLIRWTGVQRRELAERIRRERCPFALRYFSHLTRPRRDAGFGIGEETMALAELYEPGEWVAGAVLAMELRDHPVRSRTQAIASDQSRVWHRLSTASPVEIRFARAVPWQHLIRLDYELEEPRMRYVFGAAFRLTVQFFDAEGQALSGQFDVTRDVGRPASMVIPVEPSVAEWRWYAGREPARQREASSMRILVRALRLSARLSLRIKVNSLIELIPARPQQSEPRSGCTSSARLTPDAVFVSGTSALRDGDAVVIQSSAGDPAQAYLHITPCAETCLYAKAEMASGVAPLGVSIDLFHREQRTTVLSLWVEPHAEPQEIRVPLGETEPSEVLVRLTLASSEGDALRLRDLHLDPCF